jgi:hypothetical protein
VIAETLAAKESIMVGSRLFLVVGIALVLSLVAACSSTPTVGPPHAPTSVMADNTPELPLIPDEATTVVGIPNWPPIADADPAVRTDRVFNLPTALAADYKLKYILLRPAKLQPVKLQVGSKMVFGYKATHRIHWGDEYYAERSSMGSSVNFGGELEQIYPAALPPTNAPRRAVVIKTTIQVFETDIPSQHMWMPKRGKYRVLWGKTFELAIPFDKHKVYKQKGS